MLKSDDIAGRLRLDILGGKFQPGERLIELQLTENYGVGRAAIRSAIVELVKEGLVTREANRGATVRRVPIAEAIQITEARQALESLISSHAARNANETDRDDLRQIAVDMNLAVDQEEYVVYSDLNKVLHQRIIHIADHPVAGDLVDNLRNRASHHQFRLALRPGRPAESLPQHETIITAIVDGDAEAAHQAMFDHLDSVIETLNHWADLGMDV